MKAVFSLSALLALASALVSGTPISPRGSPFIVPATQFWVINNPNPAPIPPPSANAQISITNGQNEIDSIVSFDVASLPVPTSSSTCQFGIKGISPPAGSGIIQLFTLGAQVTSSTQFVPFTDQYLGQYDVSTGTSVPIDANSVPCNFQNGVVQFLIRPQNTDDFIYFTQFATSGAFLIYYP